MSERKLKKTHGSKQRSAHTLVKKKLMDHGPTEKIGTSGVATIDQYLEALRKGVMLSQ